MARIAFFNSHTLLASHYETELEIIIDHLNAGDSVVQLFCSGELPACDTNPFYQPEACARCNAKREAGYAVLPKTIEKRIFLQLDASEKALIAAVPKRYESLEALQKLVVEQFDVGFAVASSIISYYRNPRPDANPSLIERLIVSALAVYFSVKRYLKTQPTDRIYTFNGRYSTTRAVLRAAQAMGVPCFLHERGNSLPFYSLFENTTIHDMENTHRLIESAWNAAEPLERERIATEWYTTRMGGKMQNWYSFLAGQKHELPQGWDASKHNVVICSSSEDEFASLGDSWKNHVYPSQTQGIARIIEEAAHIPGLHVYLRIHPHQAKVNNAETQFLHQLKAPHLTVIPASSNLSTYFLVQHADTTITFGSTMGMEATFMRRPSILAGKSFYFFMNGTYTVASHEELMALLPQKLEPKPLEEALKFAFFFATFGHRFKHYKPEDFGAGTIGGIRLSNPDQKAPWATRFIYHNALLPKLSENLQLRKRHKALQNLMH